MLPRGLLLLAVSSLIACRSLGGRANGTCRVAYASRDPAPPVQGGDRVDRVRLSVTDDRGGHLRMTLGGCRLAARATPPEPHRNPHYLIVEGSSCDWDLPGLGHRRFDVANREADRRVTESTGDEAYANFADREIFVSFEAPVERGEARFQCEFVRAE